MSNATLVSAIVLYAVAMLAYACEFAFSRRSSAAAARSKPERVATAALVGATAGHDLSGHAFPADPADPSELADLDLDAVGVSSGNAGAAAAGSGSGHGAGMAAGTLPAGAGSRWPEGVWVRAAFALTCAGLALQLFAIATRGIAEHRVPWGNMYEFIAAVTCAAVIVLVLASVRFRAYFMGLFVLLPVVLALAVDVVVIYTPVGSLVPALQSYWIAIHVTAMIIAIGMYIFGAVVTVLYLLVARHERRVAAGEDPGDRRRACAGAEVDAARPAVLPRDPVRVPRLDLRGHRRGDLGRPRLGQVLGLGPEGDLVVHHLAGLRGVPACQGHGRLARAAGRVHPAVRVRVPDVQPGRRQPLDHRPALLRRPCSLAAAALGCGLPGG